MLIDIITTRRLYVPVMCLLLIVRQTDVIGFFS